MGRLFKHEFFKLFNSLTFKVLLGISVGYAVLNAFLLGMLRAFADVLLGSGAGGAIGLGFAGSYMALADSTLQIFFAILIVALVCAELKSRTIKITALADYSRGEIYFAKFLAMITGVTIFALIQSIVMIAVTAGLFGWGKPVTAESILMDGFGIFFMGLLLCCAVAAMFNFCAYWTKSAAWVIVIAIFLPVVVTLGVTIITVISEPVGEVFMKLSYPTTMAFFFGDRSLANLAYYIVVTVTMLVGFTLGGYFIFRKQEIK